MAVITPIMKITATITKRPEGRSVQEDSDHRILLIFPVILALFAVWLSAPKLIASLKLLPSQETIRAIGKGMPVSETAIENAAGARMAAFAWLAEPKPQLELGSLRLVQARRAGYATPRGKKFLTESIMAERQSLSLSPAQPYAWVQLLQARLALEGPSAALAPLFTMAIRTGPVEPRLVMRRLALGLSFWTFLDLEAVMLLKRQVVIAARYFPTRLAVMTKKRYALKLVRDALAEDPALRIRFDRIYRHL